MAQKPKNREMVEALFALGSLRLPGSDIVLSPSLDLAVNENEDTLYYYTEGAWFHLNDKNTRHGLLARLISSFLKDHFPELNVTSLVIQEIKDEIFRECPNRFEGLKPTPYLAFKDKSLDFTTFTFVEHQRSHYATHALSYLSTELQDTETPTFDAYLARLFDDPLERNLIYDMLGYYLIPFDDEPAFFYLYGPPRTGKSRLMHLIPKIVGERFTSAFSLQSLTTEAFTVAELAGKRLNALDEDESERVYSDKFKSLLDHSAISARRLYQPPFTFKPYAKFLFSSNQLPNFRYVEGLDRRLHIIKFSKPLKVEEQDKRMDEKLDRELPGIIFKALKAAKAFIARNSEFIDPQSTLDAKNEFLKLVVPARLFIEECCDIVDQDDISRRWASNQALYDAYKVWCEESNHKALASQNFHRQLAGFPGIQTYVYCGERRKNLVLKERKLIG